MCGRIVIARSSRDLQRIANAKGEMKNGIRYQESYNVVPGSYIPCLHCLGKEKEIAIEAMKWGFTYLKQSALIFNSRSDSVNVYSMYKSLTRCVILIEGYYEWHKSNQGRSQPYFITLDESQRKEGVIYLAGLWKDELDEDGFEIKAMSIITQEADKSIQFIHERMPLILSEAQVKEYLEGAPLDRFTANNNQLKYHQVADLVNSLKNKGEDNILEKSQVKYNKNGNLILDNFFEKEGEKLVMKKSKSKPDISQMMEAIKKINHLTFLRAKPISLDDSSSTVTGSTEVSHFNNSFFKRKTGKTRQTTFVSANKKAKAKPKPKPKINYTHSCYSSSYRRITDC